MKRTLAAFAAALAFFRPGFVPAAEKDWEIGNMPGMYDNPGVIKVVPGEVNALTFYFLVSENVLQTGGRVAAADAATGGGAMTVRGKKSYFNLTVDMTLPAGMEFIISNVGGEKHEYEIKDGKVTDRFGTSRVQPRRRLSEWKTYRFAVKVPEKAPAGGETLTMTVRDDDKVVASGTWKIERVPAFKPAPSLKYLKLGFWDYGTHHLSVAQPGIVALWKKAGFNCVFQYFKCLKPGDITMLGSRHQQYITPDDKLYPNFGPDGKLRRVALNGWYLRQKPLSELLTEEGKVPAWLNFARELNSGWVGMDYEPTGVEEGFIPGSIADFKREYNVSDAEFETMQKGVAKKFFKYRHTASDAEKKVFDKWNDYQSRLSQEFIKALVSGIKKADPTLKFHNSTLDAMPRPDVKGSGLCADASLQAKYLDMIEPQLYIIGKAVAAKYVIMRTAEWKARIGKLNPNCILHPLLIVRYANTKTRNTPEYLRLQTIGAFAEGAGGVTYYFFQCFNAYDWAEMAETVRQLAAVEEFYVKGTRCDSEFQLGGVERGYHGWQSQFPDGKRKVMDYNWHMTAHRLGKRVVVTLFNLSEKDTHEFVLKHRFPKSGLALDRVVGGKSGKGGTIGVKPGGIAYVYFK